MSYDKERVVALVLSQGFLLHNDQPVTCPKCGSRTEMEAIPDFPTATNVHYHTCLNCKNDFLTCDDDEEHTKIRAELERSWAKIELNSTYRPHGSRFTRLFNPMDYDNLIESRSAARSLDPNDEPLKPEEYLRRQHQLIQAGKSVGPQDEDMEWFEKKYLPTSKYLIEVLTYRIREQSKTNTEAAWKLYLQFVGELQPKFVVPTDPREIFGGKRFQMQWHERLGRVMRQGFPLHAMGSLQDQPVLEKMEELIAKYGEGLTPELLADKRLPYYNSNFVIPRGKRPESLFGRMIVDRVNNRRNKQLRGKFVHQHKGKRKRHH